MVNHKRRSRIRYWIAPGIIRIAQRLSSVVQHPTLEYAPRGWDTPLVSSSSGWNSASVVAAETERWQSYVAHCQGQGPLGFSHEYFDLNVVDDLSFHNLNMTLGYVLGLAAHKRKALAILDWGGALGNHYTLAKSLFPEVRFDYHCKELPRMADEGKRINPAVHWWSDESCLKRTYGLVMLNGSIQYLKDWEEALKRILPAVGEYLFLGRVPVVEKGEGYVAIQRIYGTEILHLQLSKPRLLNTTENLGLSIVREFVVGDRPFIKRAPEQCELRSWLFRKE